MNDTLAPILSEHPLAARVDPDTQVTVLLTILDGITRYTLNPDAWWLAYNDAEKQCQRLGVSPEAFEVVKARFQTFRRARKAQSPFATMHEER